MTRDAKYRLLVLTASAIVSTGVFGGTALSIIFRAPVGDDFIALYWWILAGVVAAWLSGFIVGEGRRAD